MNPKLKLGITMMMASALMLSTVASYAGTTTATTTQVIPESVLEQMLEEGLITEDQMEAYLEKIEAANLAALKSALAEMVTEGTLTQTKADAAYTAIVADLENAKTQREKMAAMSATELSAYLETIKTTSMTNALDALKTAGTLTTKEYKAIRALLNLDDEVETIKQVSTTTASEMTSSETLRLAQIKTQLTTLVTKGTLTQTQADLVYTAIVSDQETMTAEREKISTMTATELAAYIEANKTSGYVSALDALKTAGTISATQYTAVQKILKPTTAAKTTSNSATATTAATTNGTNKAKPVNVKAPMGKNAVGKTSTAQTTTTTSSTTTQNSLLAIVKTKLATMVTKGTLTQVQADAAYTAIVADQAALTAEVESIGGMTLEELVAYFQNQKTTSKTSALDALKTSGVLTKAQYNAIKVILASNVIFEDEEEQTNLEDMDMEQPPEPMPPMGQLQKRQGK